MHRARETVELLKVETTDFIPPNLCPPNSPDLNPVDYKIWSILQEQVYKTSSKDVDELRNTQLQMTSPESKFPNEYSDVIFIQIDQHLKKLLQKYKGVPIL